MGRIRNAVLAAMLVLLAVSCRPQSDLSRDFAELRTWGDVFDIFWKRMSTNYLFWSLDYDSGLAWDGIYDEYMPRFDALGAVTDASRPAAGQKENTETAFRYFFDITKGLSDGHYALKITDTDGNIIIANPMGYRTMREFGISDDDIFSYMAGNPISGPGYDAYMGLAEENTARIAEYVFGITQQGTAMGNAYGFQEMEYVDDGKGFAILLGKNGDGVVYFSFNAFSFLPYVMPEQGGEGASNAVTDILTSFLDKITEEDTTGVVIDIRGNGGGMVMDLYLLWSGFLCEGLDEVTFAQSRRKASEGRTDYGAWMDFTISRQWDGWEGRPFDKDVPIAVLVNENCLSCAEMSSLFFMALRDYHGYEVRFFGGEHTGGGFGALYYDETDNTPVSEDNYNGGIAYAPPYIELIYTPYLQMRYIGGRSYEGEGIPVDEPIAFDCDAFRRGEDARLDAAFDWIAGR